MLSKEVDRLLPLQQAHLQTPLQQAYYLTCCCYYSRLTQHILVIYSYTIPQPRKVLRRTSVISILLVAILLRSVGAILIDSLFNEELRLFRLDWPISFSGSVLLRPTNILRIAQVVLVWYIRYSSEYAPPRSFFQLSYSPERIKENRFVQPRDSTRD